MFPESKEQEVVKVITLMGMVEMVSCFTDGDLPNRYRKPGNISGRIDFLVFYGSA